MNYMLTELFSTNNYVSFNIKVAEVLGLHTAIYVSELININNKALHKNKINEAGYFKVDRKYITSRTTLQSDEQKQIEDKLVEIQILQIDPNDRDAFKIDINNLANIAISDDVKFLKDVSKITANVKQPKKTKRQSYIEVLKDCAAHENAELNQAYMDWVDGVYANPKGFLSPKSVKVFKETVDNFAQGNLDLALKIIDIATVNGYRDATWAINVFNRDFAAEFNRKYRMNPPVAQKKQKLSDEVF